MVQGPPGGSAWCRVLQVDLVLQGPPGGSGWCRVLPVLTVNVSFFEVCPHVVLVDLLLSSR